MITYAEFLDGMRRLNRVAKMDCDDATVILVADRIWVDYVERDMLSCLGSFRRNS